MRWSEAVDVRLPDIMFEVKVTLQKTLSIKVELKSLVDCNMRGDKNWMTVCQQNYWQVEMFHFLQINVKVTKKKFFL